MHKKYFVFGMQRSGTNFLEVLMRKNFGATKLNVQNGSWKHSIEVPPKYSNEFPTFVIYKNPYTWVESICMRNTVDWLKTQKTYPANEIDDKRYTLGDPPLNIVNLIKTYKHFHDTWLDKADIIIRYEDLLLEEKRNRILSHIERLGFDKSVENWQVPRKGGVSQSRDYNDEREQYYLSGKPNHLDNLQIAKINYILGKEQISNMGYEIL